MTMTTDDVDATNKDKLMSAAYTVAQRRLRSAHQDEFNRYYQEELAQRGIEWTPRKSKEELALDQIVELLTTYPDLGERLAQRIADEAGPGGA